MTRAVLLFAAAKAFAIVLFLLVLMLAGCDGVRPAVCAKVCARVGCTPHDCTHTPTEKCGCDCELPPIYFAPLPDGGAK